MLVEWKASTTAGSHNEQTVKYQEGDFNLK